MGSSHRAAGPQDAPRGPAPSTARARLSRFLTARLSEELAAVWARDEAEGRPGMAAQVAVLDEHLTTLRAGGLPARTELRWLLLGYGRHPEYDARWVELLG